VVPLSTFADQDVLKVISDNQEKGSEERKILEAKRAAVHAAEQAAKTEEVVATASPATGGVDEEATDDEEDADEEDEGGDGDDGDDGGEGDQVGESGADANHQDAGPVHEGISCDGCQVRISLS
jgi:hypothetical protein